MNILVTFSVAFLAVWLYEFMLSRTVNLSKTLFRIKQVNFTINKLLAMALTVTVINFLINLFSQ